MEENYFAGFLVCAQCGYKLYPHNLYRTRKDGTTYFLGNYGCGNTAAGACDASEMSAIKLEKAFQAYIEKIAAFEVDHAIQLPEQAQEGQERQASIAAYEEKLRRLEAKEREALDFYVSNVFTADEYRRVKRRIGGDRQALCAELQRLQAEAEEVAGSQLEIAKNFHENWPELSNKDKRIFLMQFVEKIVVENEKLGESKGRTKREVKIHDVAFREG